MGNFFLALYFRFLEAAILRVSPPFLYAFIYRTGHLFRPTSYQPLKETILENLRPFFGPQERKAIFSEMLRLEARLIMENALLGTAPERVREAFAQSPPPLPRPCLVLGGHFFNYWLLVELLRVSGQEVVLLMGEYPRRGDPARESGWRAWKRWQRQQELIYAPDGRPYEACRRVLEEGKRLFLLLDVPRPSGLPGRLLGHRVFLPAGGLKLAQTLGVETHLLLPRVTASRAPYALFHRRLNPDLELKDLLDAYLQGVEINIKHYPASWMGWAFFHLLQAKKAPRGGP